MSEYKLLKRPSKPTPPSPPTPPATKMIREGVKPPQQVEPIWGNRYSITFPEEIGIPECFVRSVSRPSMNINNGSSPYYYTHTTWDDMEIIFNGRMGQLYDQVYRNFMSYDITTQKIEIKVQIINPTGTVVSESVIMGVIRSTSYNNDDLIMIFAVDYAILNF